MPPKKRKKDSNSKKLKKSKTANVVPVESKAVDSDWWDCFWEKNSPYPGFNFFQLPSISQFRGNQFMGTCLFPLYMNLIGFKGFSFKGFIVLGLSLLFVIHFCITKQCIELLLYIVL